MAFNNVPANGWPQIKDLEKLDAIAQQIENMPNFTSDDKAFLEDLPAYPDTDGTKVLTATTSSGETILSYEEQQAGAFNYSTSEVNTNQKWIDGKDIFCKVVEFGTLPNNDSKSVSSGLSNVNIIKTEAITYGSDSFVTIPYLSAATNNKIEITYANNNTITIADNADFSAHSAYITLYYTKQTA